jgi:hypothetical protein
MKLGSLESLASSTSVALWLTAWSEGRKVQSMSMDESWFRSVPPVHLSPSELPSFTTSTNANASARH